MGCHVGAGQNSQEEQGMIQTEGYQPKTRFSPSSRAVSTEVGSETVLLHLEEGMYFGLDNVGNVIWDALKDGATFEELAACVLSAFKVDRDVAEKDLVSFLRQLEEHNLVDID